jgi:hypothetical protein
MKMKLDQFIVRFGFLEKLVTGTFRTLPDASSIFRFPHIRSNDCFLKLLLTVMATIMSMANVSCPV